MRYVFGPFELDPASARLTRDGVEVPAQAKGLRLLGLLVRSTGRLVPREEIEAELWPDVVVTDQSLRQVVRRLRAALGETHGALIETVPSHGLRFVGDVRAFEPPSVRLPPERDRFVGRQAELAALEEALGGSRVVTVLGTGGAGKTRLVLEYARRRGGAAWFCDLTEARSRDDVARSVARALEVPLGSGDPVDRVGHALAARGDALLVLDRFEQVAGHAEATVGRWRDQAGTARFAIASQHRLGLAGERVVAVGALSLHDAIELFRVRSEAAGAAGSDDPEIEDLVDRVDRLPLAIELAAARSRVLAPREIAARLADRFGLLTGEGRRPVLRSMLDWSWDLLDPDEQAALAQLSVFRGGFALEAVEAVVQPGATPILDVLQGLVDKSLVQRGDGRFDLLLVVRDYAAEQLAEAGAPEVAERRHGAFFARLGAPDAIDRIERWGATEGAGELPNLLEASARAVGRSDPEVGGGAALAASAALRQIGPFSLAAEVVEAALRVPGLPGPLEARLRLAAGQAHRIQGRREEADAHLHAAIERARDLGLHPIEIDAAVQLALLVGRERPEEGRAWVEAALALARELGDRHREAILIAQRSTFDADAGRIDEARAALEEVAARLRALGDLRREAAVLSNLGVDYRVLGRLDEARACYDRACELGRLLGDRTTVAIALGNRGGLEQIVGELERGRADLEAALALHRQLGDRYLTGLALISLGHLRVLERRWDAAREALDEAAALAVDQPRLETLVRFARALLHLALGRPAEAEAEIGPGLEHARRTRHRRLEGLGLAGLGRALLELGRLAEARVRLDEAEAALAGLPMADELALIWCTRAALEARLGDPAAARALLERARAAGASLGAGPRSELGQRLVEVEAAWSR